MPTLDPTREITALCRRLGDAHARKDADAIVACYADEAVIYDLAPPPGRRGMKRDAVKAWLDTWDGPIQIDATDVEVVVGSDVAFTTSLNRMRGQQGARTRTSGSARRWAFGERRTAGGSCTTTPQFRSTWTARTVPPWS